jgi:hypothetical protein
MSASKQKFVWGLAELIEAGKCFDEPCPKWPGESQAVALAAALLRIRNRRGRLSRLRLNSVQRLFEKRRGEQNIVLKARQLGLTTWVAARFFLKTITQPGTLSLQVAHTQEAAEAIFAMVHRFLENLPEPMRKGALKTSRSNVRQIVFPHLDSQYLVETAGDRNAGRGLTVQNLHCSELARWPGNAAETLAGLRASLAPGGEMVMESTPQGAAGCFFEEWQKAPQTGTVRHFFPWWMEPLYTANPLTLGATEEEASRALSEEELQLRQSATLSLGQIAYRRQLRANLRTLAAQEYAEDAESCFLASGCCVFDREPIEQRLRELATLALDDRDEREEEVEERRWFPPVRGRRYIAALDPAGGHAEGDWSVLEVIDEQSGRQCAEFRARIGGRSLAEKVSRIAAEYNHAQLVVERNNHGHGLLAWLAEYPNLYCAGDGSAGWLTNAATRPRMIVQLGGFLSVAAGLIQSRVLLRECRGFLHLPDGRMGAANGAHDDCVMAMAMALTVRAGKAATG